MAKPVVEFSRGTELKRFLAKNQLMSNEIIEIGVMGRCQKVWKIDFQSQFIYIKNHSNLSDFFSLKNTNLGAHFFVID